MQLWFKRGVPRSSRNGAARVGLVLGERSIALALVRRVPGQKPALEYCAEHELGAATPEQAVADALQQLNLSRTRLSAVVGLEDYQLVQVEAPEVLPSELRAAVRWRLRDVISFHIDDAVVDVFEIPDQSRRTQAKMLFAVAARNTAVQRLASAVSPSAKGFDVIDIPELALRNLVSLLQQDQRGLATLLLGDHSAQLLLTRQGVLYLTRRIELVRSYDLAPAADGAQSVDAAALALEVQRSLDYYESHFDQTPILDLVVAPSGPRAAQTASALKQETSARVSLLDVREIMSVPERVPTAELSGALLTAVGAALRTDGIQL